MIKNNKQNDKDILIACYRKPYSKESLEIIRKLLKKMKPSKVIILRISELRKSSGTVSSYLGSKDQKTLQRHYEEDQSIRATGYTEDIVELAKKMNIPVEIITKKGAASKIILHEVKQRHPLHIIIHPSEKSKMDELLTGSVEQEVCKNKSCAVTVLR